MNEKNAVNGILIIDKPAEYTSFDVIAVVRKITGQRKAGHTGTLDPNATGVLPVLLGSATKAQDLILNHDKAYTASFTLGITTDTLDIWGSITERKAADCTEEEILALLPRFTGKIEQLPPMYSAIKKNGQRLYDLARQGIEIERESRRVTVYTLELEGFDRTTQSGVLRIACSKGTYVRTLIDDIGRRLGCGAVMTSLRRTSACGFDESESITLDRARQLAQSGELEKHIRSVESLFSACRYVLVSEAQAKRFANGGTLDISRIPLARQEIKNGEIFRVKTRDNRFLGMGIADTESGQLKIYLHI